MDKSDFPIMSTKYFHCVYWYQKLEGNRANAYYIFKRIGLRKPQA